MKPSFVKRFTRGPIWALCVFVCIGASAAAQQLGVPQSGVLTISSERLFSESQFGQRIFREIEEESAELAEENEKIVAELSQEEQDLTEQRATLPPEEFTPLADAFDLKVQSHRESQRAKLDDLARRSEVARAAFFELAQPHLIDLLRESGASMIIERSSVFLSADRTDITDFAISRIDAAIGDGQGLDNLSGD